MSTQSNNNSIDALNTENDNSIAGSTNNNDNDRGDASNVGDKNNDFHAENLHRMCRICAKIIAENTRFYYVDKCVKDLGETYGVNFNLDNPDSHPSRFCFTCYVGILNFKKRGTAPVRKVVSNWEPHSKNCSTSEIRVVKSKGGRPAKKGKYTGSGRPKSVVDIRDVMKLDVNSTIPTSLQKAASHIMALTVKKSPNQLIEINSGGPNPMTLVPITVGRKESQIVSKRTLRARTQQISKFTNLVAGGSREGIVAQTAHIVKSFGVNEREDILKSFKDSVTVPADAVASMKSVLGLPWNLVRDIRRWLKTFHVSLASEGQVRSVVKDWVGTGLYAEELPATVIKDKRVSVKLKPWCYIFNLVGYVLHYLDSLRETNLLVDVSFIPSDEIFLNIGGDHGGGSFKMSFQIANVYNPNKAENTVVFSILEAKDNKSNLMLCLERFKTHIAKFSQVKWAERNFRVFYLEIMNFCVPCMVFQEQVEGIHAYGAILQKISLQYLCPERVDMFTPRSLESLKNDHRNFVDTYNSNLAKAKLTNNVISSVFFDIPLENICIPGLHITRGVYMKLLRELEQRRIR